jgi:hypothetical protein
MCLLLVKVTLSLVNPWMSVDHVIHSLARLS